MLLFIALCAIIITGFYYVIIKPVFYWKDLGVPQNGIAQALVINWLGLFQRQSVAEFIMNKYNDFKDYSYHGIYQFNTPILCLKDPDLVKQITIKDFDHFTDRRGFVPEDIDPLWAKNLFALRGQRWRDMRTTLSPSFTGSKIKEMFVLMRQCADNFIEHFLKRKENVISLEMKDTFSRYCNDIIASLAFGVEVNSLENPENDFYMTGKDAVNIRTFWRIIKFAGYLISPTLYRLLGLKIISDDTAAFFKKIINDGIKLREEKGFVRHDLINLLMEARKGIERKEETVKETGFSTVTESEKGNMSRSITNEDITAQAMVFFFGGFESVSSLMCFLAQELAENQDVQEKLREEIKEVFDNCGGKLGYDQLVAMKYMDMVVSECLRKWPTQIILERMCTKPYIMQPSKPGAKSLSMDKGTVVLILAYGIQRDPEIYPNPDRFDPERFSDENKKNIKSCTYMPFGSGPRNCIGSRFALLETKVIFFYILLNFEIVPTEKTTIPLKLAKNVYNFGPANGFWLRLKRIQAV